MSAEKGASLRRREDVSGAEAAVSAEERRRCHVRLRHRWRRCGSRGGGEPPSCALRPAGTGKWAGLSWRYESPVVLRVAVSGPEYGTASHCGRVCLPGPS